MRKKGAEPQPGGKRGVRRLSRPARPLAWTERTNARTEVGVFSPRRASFHLAAHLPLLLLGVAAPAAHQVSDAK
jgi:hypothetical protein